MLMFMALFPLNTNEATKLKEENKKARILSHAGNLCSVNKRINRKPTKNIPTNKLFRGLKSNGKFNNVSEFEL